MQCYKIKSGIRQSLAWSLTVDGNLCDINLALLPFCAIPQIAIKGGEHLFWDYRQILISEWTCNTEFKNNGDWLHLISIKLQRRDQWKVKVSSSCSYQTMR